MRPGFPLSNGHLTLIQQLQYNANQRREKVISFPPR
jgi:hypothetical protein